MGLQRFDVERAMRPRNYACHRHFAQMGMGHRNDSTIQNVGMAEDRILDFSGGESKRAYSSRISASLSSPKKSLACSITTWGISLGMPLAAPSAGAATVP